MATKKIPPVPTDASSIEERRSRRAKRWRDVAALQSNVGPDALLHIATVCAEVGLGRSSIYAYLRAGRFPAPKRISLRCVRWIKREIALWRALLDRDGTPPDAETLARALQAMKCATQS